MKKLLIGLAGFLAMITGQAQASTTVGFDTPAICNTACYAYNTDNPDVTIEYVSMQSWSPAYTYRLTMTVTGVTYQGVIYAPVSPTNVIVLMAADGTSISTSFHWHQTRNCHKVGRGQFCTVINLVDYGNVVVQP
jgi:hypothetical protein